MAACSAGTGSQDTGATDAMVDTVDAPLDAALDTGADATPDTAPTPDVIDAPSTTPHTFRYHPDWPGVTAVTVVGAFGQSNDWTAPFASLTHDASTGDWTGTVSMPTGSHPYLFRVVGDAAASPTASRYVLDPLDPSFEACPMGSPIFSTMHMSPCSVVSSSDPTTVPTYHVRGVVHYDGAPIANYMAVVERDEMNSHHQFVNRVTVSSDGAYDIVVAAGQYRVQIWYPTLLNTTDAMRNPTALNAARRALSTSFAVAADKTVPPAEMAFHDYGMMSPQSGSVALPATFHFTTVAGAVSSRCAVYSGPNIGDPWFDSTTGTATSATFDGHFNTPQAMQPMAVPGTQYYWGTWQNAAPVMGVTWTRESMVFPIAFM